jgi:hypothetical protein
LERRAPSPCALKPPDKTSGFYAQVMRNILCPAFVVVPRHPWRGEFAILATKKNRDFLRNFQTLLESKRIIKHDH